MKTFRQDIRFLWALMRHHEKYILKLRKWIFYWQKQKRIHQEIRMQCEISLFVSQKCIKTEVFKFFKIWKKYKEIKMVFARIDLANKNWFTLLKYAFIGANDTLLIGRKVESINKDQSKIQNIIFPSNIYK